MFDYADTFAPKERSVPVVGAGNVTGWVPPQPPQMKDGETIDLAMPLVSMVGGMGAAFFSKDLLPANKTLVAGALIWGASYAYGRLLTGSPVDYFGRENKPNNLTYGAIGLVSGFGSTWAMHGLWELFAKRMRVR